MKKIILFDTIYSFPYYFYVNYGTGKSVHAFSRQQVILFGYVAIYDCEKNKNAGTEIQGLMCCFRGIQLNDFVITFISFGMT